MRTLKKISFLFLVFEIILFGTNAMAEVPTRKWLFVVSDNSSSYFMDKPSKSNLTDWFLQVYDNKQKNGVKYSLLRYQFDCAGNSLKLIYAIDYSRNGKQVGNEYVNEYDPSKKAIPESVGETILQSWCDSSNGKPIYGSEGLTPEGKRVIYLGNNKFYYLKDTTFHLYYDSIEDVIKAVDTMSNNNNKLQKTSPKVIKNRR